MVDKTLQTPRFGFQKIGGSQALEPGDYNTFLDMADGALGAGTGNSWFVNETTGSDSNAGTNSSPFKTLTAALSAATADNGDVIYLSGSVHVTATVAWSKNNVHLVGLCSPSGSNRARISQTGATPFSPLVYVTASNCCFINIGSFHGGATGSTGSQVCWDENGGRNYYNGCNFQGAGDATIAALAGSRSLTVRSSENKFVGCDIGLDTIQRGTAVSATMEILGGVSVLPTRNVFDHCLFRMWSSLTTNLHVLVTALDRYTLFKNCNFFNAIDSGGGSLLAVGFTMVGTSGHVMIDRCGSVGATKFATSGNIYQVDATTGLATKIT